ncbi:BgTH12-01516 [Blumeria graminis f. sp. triticale]|uniref:Bgt-50194 n=2 Tax=Blumeria graminis TaxID=34373 RepID=A0A9X9MF98_BLUGR|nr:BgTH12-01516 [Blumeria graminis f. sp. triticale]VDB83680.1 Bgt-50194 [Blumeria graminis f. sp. tritici]
MQSIAFRNTQVTLDGGS